MASFNKEQQAALDLGIHCAVHANAGGGKTRVLTHRFLKILIETATPMDHIVAITFTRASAAEMRDRVRQHISELLANPSERAEYSHTHSDGQLCAKLHTWMREVGTARISTFHSFCASIIRQFSDELGLDTDVRDLDDGHAAALSSQATQMAMQSALSAESPLHDETLALFDDMTIMAVSKIVLQLTRSTSFRATLIGQTATTDDSWLTMQNGAVTSIMKELAIDVLKNAIETVAPFVAHPDYQMASQALTESLDGSMNAEPVDAGAIMLKVMKNWFTVDGQVRDNKIKKIHGEDVPDRPSISKDAQSIVKLCKLTWLPEREMHLFRIVRHLVLLGSQAGTNYDRLKREANGMDFDDMISMVLTLLEIPEVATTIRNRIHYLMVDEFQDTDPTQYHLLELLVPALTQPTAGGPNFFIVGDDKQSIYGFRDADVRLFRRATQAIRHANRSHGSDDGYRPLTRSYRMHQDLCTVVNTLCGRIFGSVEQPQRDDLLSYDVAYSDLIAGLQAPKSETLGLCSVIYDTEDEISAAARVIVEILDGTVHRDIAVFDSSSATWSVRRPSPGDFAVLLSKHNQIAEMALALRLISVPFHVHGGRAFFTRPEVRDLCALLTTCVDPTNDLATATVMRSHILGCTDADITMASLTGRKTSIRDGLEQLVQTGRATPSVISANTFFSLWDSRILSQSLPEFVRTVLDETRWYETISTDRRRDQIIANVEKVIDIIRGTMEGTGAGIHDAILALKPPEVDQEREGTLEPQTDAVQIMTIYGSKGLEYPIVVLPGLGAGHPPPQTISTDQLGFSLGLPEKMAAPEAPSKLVSIPSVLSHELNKILNTRREDAEARRQLYVALTRAKMHLIVVFDTDDPVKKSKGLAKMLATALLDPEHPVAHSVIVPSATVLPYVPPLVSGETLLLTQLVKVPARDMISPTDLLLKTMHDDRNVESDDAGGSGMVYGSAVHDVLASIIRNFSELSAEEQIADIVRLLATHDLDRSVALSAVEEIIAVLDSPLVKTNAVALATSRVETRLVGALSKMVVQGVIDVRMHPSETEIEVWDWKTNGVASAEHLEALAHTYNIQMCAYAWLCFQSYPSCLRVNTRLVFTKAARKGLPTVDHIQTWRREEMDGMRAAISVPAANADDHAH